MLCSPAIRWVSRAMVVFLLLGVTPASTALAATIVVNSTADNIIAGDGFCTLREAVNNANANSDTTAGDCPAGSSGVMDIVNLPAGTYKLKPGFDNTNAGGDLDILATGGGIRFAGAGAGSTTIEGPGLVVGTDRILHIGADGLATIAVEVRNLTLRNGMAPQGGGAIYVNGYSTLLIEDCVLTGNSATFGGGTSNNGNGGAIFLNSAVATIRRTELSDNLARGATGPATVAGGAIFLADSARLTLEDSRLLRNSAGTVAGTGSYARGGAIYSVVTGFVWIQRSELISNTVTSLTAGGVAVGGAVASQGEFHILNSTLAQNSAAGSGGAIYHDDGFGEISASTLVSNTALGGNGGGVMEENRLLVALSTFSGNRAAGTGGGIYVGLGSEATIDSVTITENMGDSNSDGDGGVGGIYALGATTLVRHTIVAGNFDNRAPEVRNPDLLGNFTGNGYNLIGDGTGASGFTNGVNGDIVGTRGAPVDARLGPLADNGGYTPTHLPAWGSLAIDGGDPSSYFTRDQRGFERPYGIAPDIGAVEARYLFMEALEK